MRLVYKYGSVHALCQSCATRDNSVGMLVCNVQLYKVKKKGVLQGASCAARWPLLKTTVWAQHTQTESEAAANITPK